MSSSSAADFARTPALPRDAGGATPLHSSFAMTLLGLAIAIALTWQHILTVWQTGLFSDSDDAMHMVMVRDWMQGQGWFDLTVARMDPPQGVAMHWTRVTDVPIAAIYRFFSLFFTAPMAERPMRIAWSVLLLAAFIGLVASVARKLAGARAICPAVLLAATCAAVFSQLEPGRLSHQNVQVVLVMALLRALLGVLGPRGRAHAVAVGTLCALSLSISLEELPFVGLAIALACGVWIVRGPAVAGALGWLGGSFVLMALTAFAATVPPTHWFAATCDVFSAAHLIAGAVGGSGLVVLAKATGRLAGPGRRTLAAAAVAAAVVGAVALTYPACLGDPFGAVDPLVRQVWLSTVQKSQSLGALLARRFWDTLPLAAPLLVGSAFLMVATVRESGEARWRWLAVAAFAAMGVAGCFWQVRMAGCAAGLTLFGGVWIVARPMTDAPFRRVLAALAAIPFSAVAWTLAVPGTAAPASAFGDPDACFSTAAFEALARLPAGSNVFAGIDPGPFILAHTEHATVSGPYHRDNRGLRLTIDAMLGDAATARSRIVASGATHVAICPAARQLAVYIERAPDGFAAQLRRGSVPAWLKPVDVPGTAYRVYRVVK